MVLNWLKTRFHPKPAATLKAIYIASGAGQPMQSIHAVTAIQDRGLQGDRYHDDTGHWQLLDGCQVTLITEYELEKAGRRSDVKLDDGGHRRNLLVAGVKLKDLEDKRFRIGEAVFAYHKPRPPCGYIDGVSSPGMGRALSHYSGICIRVVHSGLLQVNEPVEILGPFMPGA